MDDPTMYCLADEDGTIRAVGASPIGLPVEGEIPADFVETFALGKYRAAVSGDGLKVTIEAVPNWVAPARPPAPDDDDPPSDPRPE